MNLLLDTHIWVWSMLEPKRVSKRVAAEIGNVSNCLWVSPISSWEVVLLVEKGRLHLEMEPAAWIDRSLRTRGVREAPLTHEVVFRARGIQLPHCDPADRLLAATALVYDLTLVTADERLLACENLPLLANR